MNIFFLSLILKNCARYHCDRHVIKLILEHFQMLCTTHRVLDGPNVNPLLYKATHKNHPSASWIRESSANYNYLYDLTMELCSEYTYRYNKEHMCHTKFAVILKNVPKNIPEGPLTKFPLAMPEYIKNKVLKYKDILDTREYNKKVVRAYRKYYIKEKMSFCTWKKRDIPHWISGGMKRN
jgi:hypothetical protein